MYTHAYTHTYTHTHMHTHMNSCVQHAYACIMSYLCNVFIRIIVICIYFCTYKHTLSIKIPCNVSLSLTHTRKDTLQPESQSSTGGGKGKGGVNRQNGMTDRTNHTVTHRNTLQRTATHCNTSSQRTATH